MVVGNPEMQKIALMEDNQTRVVNTVGENFRYIDDYEKFSEIVSPLLKLSSYLP